MVEGAPPEVWVDLAFLKVRESDRVQLIGFYKTSVQPVKVEWTSSLEQGKYSFSSELQDFCHVWVHGLRKVRIAGASKYRKYSL